MGTEDDIAALLPTAPPPAPARRSAAIEQAMQRFDAAGQERHRAAGEPRRGRSAPWWSSLGQPYAGALAAAASLALVALPVAWISLGDPFDAGRGDPTEAVDPGTANAVVAEASADRTRATAPPAGAAQTTPRQKEARAPGDAPKEVVAAPAPAPMEFADVAPSPALERAPAGQLAEKGEPARRTNDDDGIVVTGSRIASPALTSPNALAVNAENSPAADTSRSSAAARVRGDWNACTVADPTRSLAGCRHLIDPAAKGAAGGAAAHLADGLSLAWSGELPAAIRKFDRAIELAPRSSLAYLNRGLAYRRVGDPGRAIADLDQAVRYAPRSARAYYQRSLLLRERGAIRRARADEARAVELDPSYAAVVR